jgi:hypothetical protein
MVFMSHNKRSKKSSKIKYSPSLSDSKEGDGLNISQSKNTGAFTDTSLADMGMVSSTTDCTGLIPAPPIDDAQAEAYEELYHINRPKAKKRY